MSGIRKLLSISTRVPTARARRTCHGSHGLPFGPDDGWNSTSRKMLMVQLNHWSGRRCGMKAAIAWTSRRPPV